jgi:hypothetical protein
VRPSRVHYFYADNWPQRLWGCAAVALSIVGWWHAGGWVALLNGTNWLLAIVALVVFAALGLIAGLVVFVPIGIPLYHERMLKNGGPFQPGDTVQILSRSHRGRVSRVYAEWQGGTVRVELGDQAKETFKDIFHHSELLRVQDDPPQASAGGQGAAADERR